MKVVTNAQMAQIDNWTIAKLGLAAGILMESAGRAVVKVLQHKYPELLPQGIAVVCGTGNNGGDGLVAARYLGCAGYPVKVLLLGDPGKLKDEARRNLNLYQNLGFPLQNLTAAEELDSLNPVLSSCALIVDAILGTGISQDLSGLTAEVITRINASAAPVVAVDLPSGLDGSTGHIRGVAVAAQTTVTLGALKTGLLLYPGAGLAGELWLADIGFPGQAFEALDIKCRIASLAELRSLLPLREADAHKGTCGKILIIAGSLGYTGAAALCSEAALRIGGGLAYLAVPDTLNLALEAKLTEVITLPLPGKTPGYLGLESLEKLRPALETAEVIAMGPGLGRAPETLELCREILKQARQPVVVDADALMALPHADTLPRNLILTPHAGEMARILGITINEVSAAPMDAALSCARRYQAVTVLKGAHSLVVAPDGTVNFNLSGNSGMASAGMGDVLTGTIAGLLAQNMEPFNAALAGVFLHGLAGDIAAQDLGDIGFLASDLLARLPASLTTLKDQVGMVPYPQTIF